MCGKFYCMASTFSSKEKGNSKVDMFPGQDICVLLAFENRIIKTKLHWGYTLPMKKDLIINARCETLLDKKIFKEDMLHHRCVVLAKGFYQKDATNHQVSFETNDDIIYMAGIYRQKEKEVVIITTAANEVMKPIHDRMPLILSKSKVKPWLTDQKEAIELLKEKNDQLKIISGHLQQSLF